MSETRIYVALTFLGMVLTAAICVGLKALKAEAALMAASLALTWAGICLWAGFEVVRHSPEYRGRR